MKKFVKLKDFLDYWLQIKKLECQANTIYGYKIIIENHLIPSIGDLEIKKISPMDIERYLESILHKKYRGKNLTRETSLRHYWLLCQVFRKLKQLDFIKKNPMKKVIRPKNDSVIVYFVYTPQMLFQLLKTIDGKKIDIPVCLAGFLGLRRAEVTGLKWNNVFFEERYIQIKTTITVAGSEIIEKEMPKNKSSVRKLYLPDFILYKLRQERLRQQKITEKTGIEFKYVMQWDNGRKFRPNYISNCFKETLEKFQFPHIRYHDLRHTFATICNDNRVSLHDISLALGHSEERTTSKIYIHTFDDKKQKTIESVHDIIVQENEFAQENAM